MEAPKKATGTITIGWGLVQVPVSVYKSTEDVGTHRSRFTKAGNEVGMKNYDKVTGEDVAYADLVMKYKAEDGTLVDLTDDEIADAAGNTNGEATLIAVVPNSELSKFVCTDYFQARPKAKDPNAVKVFGLLIDTLDEEDSFMLVQYTLRGATKLAALTSDGDLYTVAYVNELREKLPITRGTASDQERAMAKTLIAAHKVDVAPTDIENESAIRVKEYAEQKAATGGVAPKVDAPAAKPTDLMAALQASIDATAAPKKQKKAS